VEQWRGGTVTQSLLQPVDDDTGDSRDAWYIDIVLVSIYCIYLICAASLNTTAVCYYLSTNNLIFVINFNCSTPSNSATYANLTGVSDRKL